MLTEPQFQKTILDSGVTLVAERHAHVRSISIGVWIKVGSSFENPEHVGISHFIEHMLFKGTEKRDPLEIATALECRGGELNAFTDKEYTCYHATVLKDDLTIALDVLSDLVLRPTFPRTELERERKVLLQELAMVEDAPDEWVTDVFLKSVWKGEPLGQPVIGTKKTLKGMQRGQLTRFFGEHYRPENIVVSVAGNVDLDQLRDECEQFFQFGDLQSTIPPQRLPSRYKARRRHTPANTEQTHLMVGFEAGGFKSEFRFDLLILSFFLGGGMSSRLFQEVREKAALAYTVDCDYIPFSESGLFTIYAALGNKSLGKCLEILGREILRLKDRPLTHAELDLVKGQLRGTLLLAADEMETRQESIGRNEIVFERYVPVGEVVKEIERVDPDRLHRLAQDLFVPAKESVMTLGRTRPRKKRLSLFS